VLPHVIPNTVTNGTPVHAFARNAPSATPGHTDDPQSTSPASAIPVGGQIAVTLPVAKARSSPIRADT
jgi:hypothetical protein